MESRWITTLAEFDAVRAAWERLYRSDPSRQLFLSWKWLRAYLSVAPAGWQIAVVAEGDDLTAALPLQIRGAPHRRVPIARELAFASEPIGDYQGMLCLPDRQGDAIPRLYAKMRELSWDRAALLEVADARIVELLALAERDGCSVTLTGHAVCRSTRLPATWPAFRATLSRKTRYQTEHSLRRLRDALPGFRMSTASDADIDAHVEAMVRVNHARWGGNIHSSRRRFGRLFRAAHEQGCLRLHVLWDGGRPVAGAASFTDAETSTNGLFQLAYDPHYGKFGPGKAVLGVALRDAVEQGYRIFDFLRGDEEYKAAYAQETIKTAHYRVRRRVLRSLLHDAILPSYRTLKAAAARVVYGPGRTV